MTHPRLAVEDDDLHIWRVAASALNKQPQTADKGGQIFHFRVGHRVDPLL